MKKGFTLVELIAVVVILGIILVIAVPRITDVIESAKINSVIKNEEMLVRATRNYLVSNDEKFPTEIGDTEEITLEELQNNDLISSIKSPFGNNNCNGYVLITKINDTNFDYTPHLNCVDYSIGSSEADKLVLHYKFDDFQEPTKNLVLNGNFENNYTSWTNINHNIIELIEDPTNPLSSGKVIKNANPGEAWGTARQSNFGLEIGKTYTLSYWVKHSTDVTQSTRFFIYVKAYDKLPNNNDFVLLSNNFDGNWKRVENTFVAQYENYFISIESAPNSIGNSYITGVAIEEKNYSTPFISGIREGLVIDYSKNNYHANLNLNTTPKWLFDEERKSGVYEFDGNESHIRVQESVMDNMISNSFSISFWIYPYNISGKIMDVFGGGNYGWSNGGVAFGHHHNNQWYYDMYLKLNGRRSIIVHVNQIPYSKWTHLVLLRNRENNSSSIYINGELYIINSNVPGSDDINWNKQGFPLRIGLGRYEGTDGKIDNVRIYNRALNTEEIKMLYKIENS